MGPMRERKIFCDTLPLMFNANVIDADDGRYYDDDGGNSNEERFLASQDALKVC